MNSAQAYRGSLTTVIIALTAIAIHVSAVRVAAAAPPDAAKQAGKEDTVGPLHFTPPAGWNRVEPKGQAGVVVVYVAPDSTRDQRAAMVVSAAPLGGNDFKRGFEQFIGKWVGARTVFSALDGTPLDDQGYEVLSRSVEVQ